ncbi:hypothetical protein Q2T40_13225 [Winogradskyella maritima]|nr:hypothetical protein [Winogradskyella maritima]
MPILFLHTNDIVVTHEVSIGTARQIIKEVNTHYKSPKRSYISVKAYCDYFLLDKDDVLHCLETYRKKAS